jgi:tetratricopeptide (TPR) repeat protein
MRRCLIVASLLIVLIASAASADWKAGVAAYNAKNYQEALKQFKGVLQTNASYAGAHWMVAKCYQGLGRDDAALGEFREAKRLDPTNPQFAVSLALALVGAGQGPEAVAALEGVKLDNLNSKQRAVVLVARSQALLLAGDATAASDAGRQATQADPSSADAWASYGLALAAADKNADAFVALRRAWDMSGDLTIAKNAVAAGINAARVAAKGTKEQLYDQVSAVATKLADKRGGSEGALLAAEALLGAGEYDQTLTFLDRSGLDNALVTYYRGQCFIGKGDAKQAEKYLRDALMKQPSANLRRNIYRSLGFVLDKQQRYPEAGQAYKEAGDAAKVADMAAKEAKFEQNKKAEEEQRKYEELKKLQEQYKQLSGGAVAPTPTPTPPK